MNKGILSNGFLFAIMLSVCLSGCVKEKIPIVANNITLSQNELTLAVGAVETLIATVVPDNATDKSLIWSSNNVDVVTVNQNGKVTAVGAGTAAITATTSNGIKVTCAVTVNTKYFVVAYQGSANINTSLVTHIIFAFGVLKEPNFEEIELSSTRKSNLRAVANLKNTKPALKILLSIGGWEADGFSQMAGDNTKRLKFASDCKRVIDEYNIDGIDLDWEFPTSSMAGIASSPDDMDNFTLLCRDIRTAIGNDKLLTVATATSTKYINNSAIMAYVDFINIMCYEFADPPYHHSPLHRSDLGWFSCESAVKAHYDAGVPYNKMVLGIPFYGRAEKNIQSGSRSVHYKDIIGPNWLGNPAYSRKWENVAKVPYLVDASGKLILSYDDAESIAEKCNFIREKEMLGAMYWHYSYDDDNSTLRKAVFNGLGQ